jgi:predicted urease superfamily metal-dependent hydrolase
MSEMSNTQMQHSAENVEQVEQETLVALALAGFTPAETARLLTARNRIQHGDLNEWTDDYKRLRFARWLYEHGHLEG